MKNILNLYLIIFCLFFVAGCSLDDDAATVKLTIIKSDLDMKASGGTGTVEFAATGTVTATVNADWCQVIEVADRKVSISVVWLLAAYSHHQLKRFVRYAPDNPY